MKTLDFAVIGAQKAGTTSLRHYLWSHPEIYTPEGEAPFFTRDSLYEDGWQNFADSFFSTADQESAWGVVSPQYMGDLRAPQRLHEHNPDLKLIALLRDPIERARSHHRMAVRRQQENRSFEEAVLDLLEKEQVNLSPPPPESECYLEWSRYGLIVEKYLEYFDRSEILFIFTDDIKKRPIPALKDVFSFLEVEKKFIPKNIGNKYHASGPEEGLSLIRRSMKKVGLHLIWRRVLNSESKKKIYDIFRAVFKRLKISYKKEESCLSEECKERLKSHFKKDINKLKEIGVKATWKKYQN